MHENNSKNQTHNTGNNVYIQSLSKIIEGLFSEEVGEVKI